MSHPDEVHGHAVLALVHTATGPVSRAALRDEAARRWGAAARYCTCSLAGMTFDELLAFFLGRGKLVEHDGWIAADLSKICGDDDHAHGAGEALAR